MFAAMNLHALRFNACIVAAIMVLAGSGCGPSGPVMYSVSGTVTFEGEPLPDGQITFTPEDPSLAPDSGPIANGKFSFRARPGRKKVEIEAARFVGPDNPIMGLRAKESYIPERYNIQSTLKAEVLPDGENSFEFVLMEREVPPAR